MKKPDTPIESPQSKVTEQQLRDELEQLQVTAAQAKPTNRLAAIRQKLTRVDTSSDTSRLVTLVSAVEALARSLVAHAPTRPEATAHIRYGQARLSPPNELVREVFRLYGAGAAAMPIDAGTWDLFELACQYRSLAVHECISLAADRYAPLIEASESVLQRMIEAGGLPRVVT